MKFNHDDRGIPETSPLFSYGGGAAGNNNEATSEQIFDFLMDNPPASSSSSSSPNDSCHQDYNHHDSWNDHRHHDSWNDHRHHDSWNDHHHRASMLDAGTEDFDPELIRQQHLIAQQIAMEQIQQQQQQQHKKSLSSSFFVVEQKPYGTPLRDLKPPSPLSEAASSTSSSRSIHTESTPIPAEPTLAVAEDDKEHVRLAEERVSQGQCPSCGQQLYKLTSSSSSQRKNVVPRWKKLFPFGGKNDNNKKSCSFSDSEDAPVRGSGGASMLLRKKPLHIPGRVHRGQCVPCSKVKNTEEEFEANVFLQDDEEEFQEDMYLQNSILHPLTNTSAMAKEAASGAPPPALATYTGPTDEAGQRHGSGVLSWSNGDVYKGHFVHGARQGPGTLTFAAGQGEYVGDWHASQMHGHGTRRFPNGDLYTGPYVQGQRHGTNGRFYFANGDLYVGEWSHDQMHGFGRYYYHHGQRFEGDFVQGQRHGKGKLQRLDGSLDIHRYRNNVRQGEGVRWSADRLHAWKLHTNGTTKTKIPIAQAVSCVYEIENTIQEQTTTAHTSDLPLQGQMGLTV